MNSEEKKIDGSFETADDLLWQAREGKLANRGKLLIARSGQIGPAIEMVLARKQIPDAYANVALAAPFCGAVETALSQGTISGSNQGAQAGVFPLKAKGSDKSLWELWVVRAEQAAKRAGLVGTLPAQLMGALGELKDNVIEHSGNPSSGLIAYGATAHTFEFVVADAGVGVLASLRQNPEFARLPDAGEALRAAASDGVSRYGRASGHGFGVGQVFRALASHSGRLRFRSDDFAWSLSGDSPSLTGKTELVQKAWLTGLTITVLCEGPAAANVN